MEQLNNRPTATGGQNQGDRGDELLVKDVYTKFDRRKSVGYTVITPDTSLDVLEEFLKDQKFAIGTYPVLPSQSPPVLGSGVCRVWADLVTDESRKFVLGVATRSDLEEFAKRRVY